MTTVTHSVGWLADANAVPLLLCTDMEVVDSDARELRRLRRSDLQMVSVRSAGRCGGAVDGCLQVGDHALQILVVECEIDGRVPRSRGQELLQQLVLRELRTADRRQVGRQNDEQRTGQTHAQQTAHAGRRQRRDRLHHHLALQIRCGRLCGRHLCGSGCVILLHRSRSPAVHVVLVDAERSRSRLGRSCCGRGRLHVECGSSASERARAAIILHQSVRIEDVRTRSRSRQRHQRQSQHGQQRQQRRQPPQRHHAGEEGRGRGGEVWQIDTHAM